jgi:hypothetical protein
MFCPIEKRRIKGQLQKQRCQLTLVIHRNFTNSSANAATKLQLNLQKNAILSELVLSTTQEF